MLDEDKWMTRVLDERQQALLTETVLDPKVSGVIVACAMVSGAVSLLEEQGFTPEQIGDLVSNAARAMLQKRAAER